MNQSERIINNAKATLNKLENSKNVFTYYHSDKVRIILKKDFDSIINHLKAIIEIAEKT